MAIFSIQRASLGEVATGPQSGGSDGAKPFILLTDELIADHAGPMVLFDETGAVQAANSLADPILAALSEPLGDNLRVMLEDVLNCGIAQSKRLNFPIAAGEGVFDVVLLPEGGAEQDPDRGDGQTGGEGGLDRTPRRVLLLARDSTFDVNLGRALVASRQLFKDLVSCSSDFVWETDADGCFAYISGGGFLGYSTEELDGRPARDLLVDMAADGGEGGPNPFESRTNLDEVECWLLERDGAHACVRASCVPVIDDDGVLQGVRGVCRDITEATLHRAALARAEQRERISRSIIDSIRDALTPGEMFAAAADATAKAIAASHVWILRHRKDTGLDLATEHNAAEADDIDILEEAAQSFAGDLNQVSRAVIGHHQLLLVPCHYRHQPKGVLAVALDDVEAVQEATTTLLDIASHLGIAIAQAEVQERLEELSSVDELTGLLNRRGFYDTVGKRLAQHKRNRRPGALLYIDMDHFKSVNDTHGHQTGDAALITLARIMSNRDGREGDIPGRLGGDEFAVWLEETGPEGARHKAEELLAASADLRRFSGDEAHPLSVSIGVALADPDADDSLDALINRADSALYQAKRNGRGQVVMVKDSETDESDGVGGSQC